MSEPLHTCRAAGCRTLCPTARLMCPRHWATVPWELRAAEVREWLRCHHRPQRSAAWYAAARACIDYVRQAEARQRMEEP